MPAAMSHAGSMPAPAYIVGLKISLHSLHWRTRQRPAHMPAHKKGVGLELDRAIAGHASTRADIQKRKALAATRSLVGELEHVGLHLLEPRPLPWRHGVEIHLHDLHPGHHACESHFFRLDLGVGGLDL